MYLYICNLLMHYAYRLATELKLLAIMTKYDAEIGNRCRTLEKLNEIYKYDKLKKHDSEVTFLQMHFTHVRTHTHM